MELLIDGKAPACALFSGPYYFAWNNWGFRKIIDTTFGDRHDDHGRSRSGRREEVLPGLRRAQRDIDLHPERYTHHYKKEFPARFLEQMDTRRWGPGERIVFESYTQEVYEESFQWIAEHEIFAEGTMGECEYGRAVVSLSA